MKHLFFISMIIPFFLLLPSKINAECDFKPGIAITIEESTNITLGYEIQVMRKKESPTSVHFHDGLRAVYETCSDSWMIRDIKIYYNSNEAIDAQERWISKGYVGSFIVPTFVYTTRKVVKSSPAKHKEHKAEPTITTTSRTNTQQNQQEQSYQPIRDDLSDSNAQDGQYINNDEKVPQKALKQPYTQSNELLAESRQNSSEGSSSSPQKNYSSNKVNPDTVIIPEYDKQNNPNHWLPIYYK